MPLQTPLRVSVSSWALHSLLGTVAPGRAGEPSARLMDEGKPTLDLIRVPALLKERGFGTMELCHFHIPDRSACFLAEMRGALELAGVELWSFLIDDGDVTHPETGPRDRNWIIGQMDIAADLGARCVRVIAGKQPPTPENLRKAQTVLEDLAAQAFLRGLRVLTENWFPLLAAPEPVNMVMDGLNGAVGLCLDFGNWSGETKYEALTEIANWAESCHAKCSFTDGKPEADDFVRCLEITKNAHFSGPYTLVYGEPGAVWESLETQRQLVLPYLSQAAQT